MKLNSKTKQDLQVNDLLQDTYSVYRIMAIIKLEKSTFTTIQDIKTGQTIYAMPISNCYDAF